MAEITINLPGVRLDKKTLKDLEKDIGAVVRLRIAREMLLADWERRMSKSRLTDADVLRLGRKANKAAADRWKKKGLI